MKLKHIATGLITASLPFIALAHPVFADMCNESYGTTTCQATDLTVNKQVAKPIASGSASQVFVENLTASDAVAPGQEVTFKLTVKNASGQTFNPVSVTDVLPAHLTFVAGPGTYDQPGKPGGTLRFNLDNMIAGETRTVEILTKVVDAKALPKGPSTFCEDNTANVSALNRNDQDKAQVCIGTQVLGATTLPIAGFNDLALLVPFMGLGLGGLSLIKLGKKS
jgi:uncharacterized repeat protein (TIGR01451 family)